MSSPQGMLKDLHEKPGQTATRIGETVNVNHARITEEKRDSTCQLGKQRFKERRKQKGKEASRKRKDVPDLIEAQLPPNLILPGAKLKLMSQSLAYKIIRRKKMNTFVYQDALDRWDTRKNITQAHEAVSGINGTVEQTWSSDRGICSTCGGTESMEHILTKCTAAGQRLIWDLTSELWKKKPGDGTRPSLGEIMACGMVEKGNRGESKFFRIIVSESAYLIWKLRNERVIGAKGEAPEREITNRWLQTINIDSAVHI
ncbi:hypothetical protein R3P38DRAFT_3315443 [Favolaschia claudopus]|uniref:Reverse transcriptase zinc-binding domain-containing protein n=1 Tax=Favolaschia claudopus TaxID=2862362 RepID=A0AAW0BLS6_9AGAR